MKNKNKRTAIWTTTICGCLCLLAVGAGVVWQAMDYKETVPSPTPSQARVSQENEAELQPVTMAQTPTVDETKLEEQNQTKVDNNSAAAQPALAPNTAAATEPDFDYPVSGEIVMPYSVECAIYDPTLNQYHTNDSVSISAQAGDAVVAAQKGTVKEITKDEEKGNSVVIEHDNGWLTTYSQLAEDISVEAGETVAKGQTIGKVGEPTKYTIALGSHVEFAVAKDGETVDPEKAVQD